jgi:hypothetical protein
VGKTFHVSDKRYNKYSIVKSDVRKVNMCDKKTQNIYFLFYSKVKSFANLQQSSNTKASPIPFLVSPVPE